MDSIPKVANNMLFWTILVLFLRFVISRNADRELMLAAEKGDIKLMKEMLEKGARKRLYLGIVKILIREVLRIRLGGTRNRINLK